MSTIVDALLYICIPLPDLYITQTGIHTTHLTSFPGFLHLHSEAEVFENETRVLCGLVCNQPPQKLDSTGELVGLFNSVAVELTYIFYSNLVQVPQHSPRSFIPLLSGAQLC